MRIQAGVLAKRTANGSARMAASRWIAAVCSSAVLVVSCSGPAVGPSDAGTDAFRARDGGRDTGYDAGDADYVDAASPLALQVQALGVQGFVVSYGGESILTAPLFTRQIGFDVATDVPIVPDVAAIDEELSSTDMSAVRAIVSGHAHFDHLLDVVHVMTSLAPAAPLYANLTAQHIFAAVAPDRDASCTSPAPTETIDRSRVLAMDDPLASHVDYTNCPDQRPDGAPLEGSWVRVPGSHVRLYPVCTTHPNQIGSAHFAPGNIDVDQCDLPAPASGWLEGHTMSFVIDFLDDADAVVFRVFYQDAPATSPVGDVPSAVLAEHRVDLAILCLGSNDAVDGQPTDIIANLDPRFVFSGHWEDFLRARGSVLGPIPFLNVDLYVERADLALAAAPDVPMYLDGVEIAGRHVVVYPGSRMVVPLAP
jgi:hypothetical protein